ncbi:MAG: hemerythrin domain-containing protein [Betaproteobacteria bacterium]|nr:MAG: hemerythrin domain-containing protein [Betaproteobacteria bacterium]
MLGLPSSDVTDAIDLLRRDHEAVEDLFDQLEDARESENDEEMATLVASVCSALTVHAQIEEELFYPAIRQLPEAADMVDEAAVEHQMIKDLVAQLEAMHPGDDLFEAKVTVLSEYVKHHVKEEEGEIFPEAKDSDIDLEALGKKLAVRKTELAGEPGAAPPARKSATATKRHARASSRAKTSSRKSARKKKSSQDGLRNR